MQRKATGSEKGRGPDHVTEMIPIDGRARQEGAVLRRVHPLATAYTLSARKFTFTAYCLSGSKPLGKSFRDIPDFKSSNIQYYDDYFFCARDIFCW